jgi:hypothetical protein
MGIRNRNLARGAAIRTIGSSFWDLLLQPTDATEHLTAGTLNAKIVGDSPTGFAAFYTKNCQSLFVTPAFSGLTALTLKLTGINQFGETVSENLVFAAATAQQTTLCYTRLTGCVIVAMTGTPAAGDTVSIGYSLVSPRLPLLAKLQASGSVKAVSNSNQLTAGSQPTFTVSLTPAWAIVLTGTPVIATVGLAHMHVTLDPNDQLL